MQNNRWLQTLIVLLVIIASLFLIGQVWLFLIQFSNVILLFFLSWLLAFMLRPGARWLAKRGMHYGVSVMVVYAVLVLVFVVGGFLLVPVITSQIQDLIQNFDTYTNQIATIVNDGQELLKSWGVRGVDIEKFYNDLAGQAQTIALSVLTNTFNVMQSIATLTLQLILILILSFYFIKDSESIFGGMMQMLPPRWREEAKLLAVSIERSFGAFVRGQLIFALVYAVFTALVMMFFGLDYVVIASIVSGLCMVIPLIGNLLAFAPPLLVCLVSKPNEWFWVLLWLFIAQSFMMNFIGPRIMSQAIGIHPLYVMAAMLVGAQVAGFWGALFGIPVAGVLNLTGRPLMRRIRYQTSLYDEISGTHLTTRAFVTGPLKSSLPGNQGSLGDGAQAPAEAQARMQTEKQPDAPVLAAPDAQALEEAQGRPQTQGRVSNREQAPVTGRTQAAPDFDYDYGYRPAARPPTLSGRIWNLAWVLVSRAYAWVGSKVHVRSPRH